MVLLVADERSLLNNIGSGRDVAKIAAHFQSEIIPLGRLRKEAKEQICLESNRIVT
jgi:hypothetical protein